MADNTRGGSESGTAPLIATDEVTYSGDVSDVQLVRTVHVTGSEGSKTVVDTTTSEGNLKTITLNRLGAATVLDAQDEALTVVSDGYSTVRFQITALTLDELSRLRTEVSVDGGTSWIGVDGWWDDYVFGTGVYPAAELGVGSAGHAAISGTTHVRCRLTNYTSGSVTLVASLSEESVSHPLTVLAGTEGTDDSGVTSPVSVVGNSLQTTLRDSTGDSAMDDANDAVRASVVTSTLPTGAATSALQTQPGVDIGDVTVNNAAGAAAVNIQDGGNAITVDGTVAVTGVSTAANQATEITWLEGIEASVGVTAAAVETLGTSTYIETGSLGMTLGAVRRDADTTLVGTTNEFSPLQVDANGRLKVEAFSGETLPVSVSGVATAANQSTEITALQKIDDPVQVLGTDTYTEATSSGMTLGAVRRDADTTLVGTTNEFGPLQMDANGRLKVEAFSGETLPISGTVTANAGSGPFPVSDNAGSLTVDAPVGTPVNVQVGNATISAGVIDETGASAVDALAVGGGTPHDSVDSGNPLKVGMKAANALPTAVANADRANAISDLWGRQMTTHIDPAQQLHANKNFTSTQTGIDVIDPTSGKKLAITSVVIGTYGTTAGRIILWFGDNADTTFTQDTDQVLLAFSTAPSANSKPGLVFTPTVPVFCTTADRELHITTDAGISLDLTVEYYEW